MVGQKRIREKNEQNTRTVGGGCCLFPHIFRQFVKVSSSGFPSLSLSVPLSVFFFNGFLICLALYRKQQAGRQRDGQTGREYCRPQLAFLCFPWPKSSSCWPRKNMGRTNGGPSLSLRRIVVHTNRDTQSRRDGKMLGLE